MHFQRDFPLWKKQPGFNVLCCLQVTLHGEQPLGGAESHRGIHSEGREDRADLFHPAGKLIDGHTPRELNIQQKQEAGEDEEQNAEQDEDEHRKELEEEEMEQAGQPERLTEDLDQVPEEHAWKEKEQTEEETNILGKYTHLEVVHALFSQVHLGCMDV